MERGEKGSVEQEAGLDPLKVPGWIILCSIWGALRVLVPQGDWVNESLLHQSLTQVIHEMGSVVLAWRLSFDPAAPVLGPHPLSSSKWHQPPCPTAIPAPSRGSCCTPFAWSCSLTLRLFWRSSLWVGWCQDTSPKTLLHLRTISWVLSS